MRRGFIDYGERSWCAFCGRKVKPGEESSDKNGRPRCRKCGKPLRQNSHNKVKAPT